MINTIDEWLYELRAATLSAKCEMDHDDPDNVQIIVTRDDGQTVKGSGRTFTEAIRDALETYRLGQFTAPRAGERLYEATIVERILDSRKPHRRTRKRFVAESDAKAAQLAAHAFRDRPGFLSGSAKFIETVGVF